MGVPGAVAVVSFVIVPIFVIGVLKVVSFSGFVTTAVE